MSQDDALLLRAPKDFLDRMLQVMRSVTQSADQPGGSTGPNSSGGVARSGAATGSSRSTRSSGSAGSSGSDTPDSATGATPEAASLTMEELVRDHADAVYRVALSVTRNPVLAEDASQDALIKAWQSLPSYRGDAPIRHWILRITHNVSISLLRKRREDVMAPLDMPDQASPRDGVESQVQDRLAIGRFEDALKELDGISRSIVVLREVEGLSYSEMSDVLQLPLPTIRTRLLRARRQLADALDGWQP